MSNPTKRFHIPSALRPSELRIPPERVSELISRGALLIDVRRQDDPAASLEGAERISPDMVPGRVAGFPRDVPIVLACT